MDIPIASIETKRPSESALSMSSICLSTPDVPVVTRCGHLFCSKCIFRWLNCTVNCPVCKCTVLTDDVIRVFGNGATGEASPVEETPMDGAGAPISIRDSIFARIHPHGREAGLRRALTHLFMFLGVSLIIVVIVA